MSKFVVLHHTGTEEAHFDVMFELDEKSSLVTFRVAEWPIREQLEATRLRDHRRFYLTFEGEVSAGRGRVDRVAEGDVQVQPVGRGLTIRDAADQFQIDFQPASSDDRDPAWTASPRA